MHKMKLRGRVQFLPLEGGFWGIIGDDNQKYLPINMPEQLKTNGQKIVCRVVKLENAFSLSMWGTPVRIVAFETSHLG